MNSHQHSSYFDLNFGVSGGLFAHQGGSLYVSDDIPNVTYNGGYFVDTTFTPMIGFRYLKIGTGISLGYLNQSLYTEEIDAHGGRPQTTISRPSESGLVMRVVRATYQW